MRARVPGHHEPAAADLEVLASQSSTERPYHRISTFFADTVLREGEAAQTNTLRWEDYSQTAVDPSDDCTIWYVGDYVKRDETNYTSRIGAFRVPNCR